MFTFLHLLVTVLASGAIVDFIQKASLLENFRVRQETANGFFKYLIRCRFCLTHWAVWFTLLGLVGPSVWWPSVWTQNLFFVAYWLTAVKLCNLIADLVESRQPEKLDSYEPDDVELKDAD